MEYDATMAAFMQTSCYAALKALRDEYTQSSSDQSKNVQFKYKVENICAETGFMYPQNYNWNQIGAAPFNRGGEGLLWSRAHSRVLKVKTSGFSEKVFSQNAYAIEDCPFTREFAKYTEKVCSSDPRYAQIKAADVLGACAGATHASHGFSCVKQGVPCDIDEITTNGRMDIDKICKGDPVFLDALSKPMKFMTFKWVVFKALPEVFEVFGAALNELSTAAEGGSFAQVMLQIVDEARKYKGDVNWKELQKKSFEDSTPPPWRHCWYM